VLFVCKPNLVPKLSPIALRAQNFGVVTVCRTPESDLLRNNLSAKWNGCITVVEDTAILDASLDIVTSRKVRDKIKSGENVEQLVGEKINDYAQIHRLGAKVRASLGFIA
jgi:nicotinic acid mononucleotide adenylyltransferase